MIEFHKSNAEIIAQGRTRTHKPECMCGLCVYSRLFTSQTNLKCNCPDPDWVYFNRVNLAYTGTFCRKCGNLHYTALSTNTFDCEGCGKFFSYDYREFLPERPHDPSNYQRYPKVKLCRRCDVPVPSNVNGRSGFRIN
jgi:hypothetical protein